MARTLILMVLLLLPALPAHAAAQGPETAITAFLRENYPWREVEVSEVKLRGTAPSAPVRRVLLESGALPGRAAFVLEFESGDRLAATAAIKAYDRVVMSRRAFGKGTVLQAADVYEVSMDVTRIPRDAVHDRSEVIGLPLNRSVLANVPLAASVVADAPKVQIGRKVSLVYDAPGLVIRAQGETRQSAMVGERVKVVNLSSKKVLVGQLVDENTVKVAF